MFFRACDCYHSPCTHNLLINSTSALRTCLVQFMKLTRFKVTYFTTQTNCGKVIVATPGNLAEKGHLRFGAGVAVEYRPLKWYECLFTKQQFIEIKK